MIIVCRYIKLYNPVLCTNFSSVLSSVMAVKLVIPCKPDNSDTLLYVETEKDGQLSYRGFKMLYLAQQLSAMESDFLSCSKCEGISRDAISSGGETLCELCKEENTSSNPAENMRNSVSIINIKCPVLRNCDWRGKLLEGEEHLRECGTFLITCPLECGGVIRRCEMTNHLDTDCALREVKCEFCDVTVISRNLADHLEICQAHPIASECNTEFRRDEVKEHIDTDCELTEIECPYAKYGCKIGKIHRKDLLAHKKEFYIEHQDMIERENCLKTNKLELLEEQYEKLKEEKDQFVQTASLKIEVHCSKLQQEQRFRKKLLGVAIDLDLASWITKSAEFGNGLYTFMYSISLLGKKRKISLQRLAAAAYSNKNILCITDCVLSLQGTTTETPYYVNERVCSRMGIHDTIDIMTLQDDILSKYRQSDGIVKMEVYFDYDYITYTLS